MFVPNNISISSDLLSFRNNIVLFIMYMIFIRSQDNPANVADYSDFNNEAALPQVQILQQDNNFMSSSLLYC